MEFQIFRKTRNSNFFFATLPKKSRGLVGKGYKYKKSVKKKHTAAQKK